MQSLQQEGSPIHCIIAKGNRTDQDINQKQSGISKPTKKI